MKPLKMVFNEKKSLSFITFFAIIWFRITSSTVFVKNDKYITQTLKDMGMNYSYRDKRNRKNAIKMIANYFWE